MSPILRSYYSKSKRYQQDLSRKTEDVYELKDGEPVKVGEVNVYDKIQSYKDECDIYNIIKRYEAGDFSAIPDVNSRPQIEGDVSDVPTDMIGSYANMDQAITNFNKLPKAIRELYHNNVSEFMKASPEDIALNIDNYAKSLYENKSHEDGKDGEK